MADRPNFKVFTVILIATFVGGLVAWAGSDGGERFRSIPVFALCGAIAFAVNWVAFIPNKNHLRQILGWVKVR